MATQSPTHLTTELAADNERLNRWLCRTTRHMNVRRYRLLKLILAFAVVILTAFGVSEGGDATVLVGLAIPAAVALAGFELGEIYTLKPSDTDDAVDSTESSK